MRDIASIVGLKVIASKEGREVGTVSQVIVNLTSGAIEGLLVGKGPTEKGIDAADIDVIGTDAVMVSTHRVAKPLSELPHLLQKRRDPQSPPREVLTDTGKRIGVLGTIYIDPHSKRVTRYEVSGGAWRDLSEGVLSLPPMEGTVDGHDSVIVPTSAFASVSGGTGGLKAQLAKLSELARLQAKQAAESLEEVKRSVETVSEKASEAASKVKQTVAERAATVTEKKEPATGEASKPEAENVGESLLKKLRQSVAVVSEKAQEVVARVPHKDEGAPAEAQKPTEGEPTAEAPPEAPAQEAQPEPEPCCEAAPQEAADQAQEGDAEQKPQE